MVTFPKPVDIKVVYKVGIKEAACAPLESMEEYDALLIKIMVRVVEGRRTTYVKSGSFKNPTWVIGIPADA